MSTMFKYWWQTLLGLATLAGFTMGIVIWEIPIGWKAALMSVVYGIPIVVAVFVAGVQLAPRITRAREAPGQATPVSAGLLDDATRLGVVRIVQRGEVSGRIPPIRDFLQAAQEEILMPVYAPTEVKLHYETLIEKINSPLQVRVTVILPDPTNRVLMDQIASFAESRQAYFGSLKGSLETMKVCWERASDKSRFSTYVFNGMLMFAGIILDRKRATISFQAQGWGLGKRVLLQLDEGPLLRACLETCQSICESSSTVRLADGGDYDRFMAAVEEL